MLYQWCSMIKPLMLNFYSQRTQKSRYTHSFYSRNVTSSAINFEVETDANVHISFNSKKKVNKLFSFILTSMRNLRLVRTTVLLPEVAIDLSLLLMVLTSDDEGWRVVFFLSLRWTATLALDYAAEDNPLSIAFYPPSDPHLHLVIMSDPS